MMPRFVALSTAEIRDRTSFASFCSAPATVLLILRSRVSTRRLRRERTAVWRARLEADLVLAMVKVGQKTWAWRLADDAAFVNLRVAVAHARKRRGVLMRGNPRGLRVHKGRRPSLFHRRIRRLNLVDVLRFRNARQVIGHHLHHSSKR